jgi:hypothetical protein
MRHGCKTKSKRFTGYKRHLAIDLDTLLILAIAVLPANRPEKEAAPGLVADITAQGLTIDALFIDRGYINATIVDDILARRGVVVCRPWLARNGDLFAKADFKLNMRDRTITCPAGEQQPISLGAKVEFPAETCRTCPLRAKSPVDAEVSRRDMWAVERMNSTCAESLRSATSRSFNDSSTCPHQYRAPGPHDHDGFNPVGALDHGKMPRSR